MNEKVHFSRDEAKMYLLPFSVGQLGELTLQPLFFIRFRRLFFYLFFKAGAAMNKVLFVVS